MTTKGKNRSKKRTSRPELNAEVLLELDALEVAVHSMLEAYEMRVTSRIAEIRDSIRGSGSAEVAGRPLTIRKATEMLGALRDLELKAERGRARDLSRVSRVTKLLARLADDG